MIVLAASMSTVDSLLILSFVIRRAGYPPERFDPHMTERKIALAGKLVTVVRGIAAVLFALGEVRVIFWFVLFAWSGLACAFTPAVLCSLFWKRTTRAAAVAGMIAGFVIAVVWVISFKAATYDLYEMIPGFAVAFLVIIVVSLLTTPPDGAAEELDDVRRAVTNRPRRSSGSSPSIKHSPETDHLQPH